MPYLPINGCDYYYEIEGPADATETIFFSHGLLWSTKLFWKQVLALKEHYRVVLYDHRGQGKSSSTPTGYEMEQLALDAAALIEALGFGPVHFAGLSMGGFVAMSLAAHRPELIKSIILMDTSCDVETKENAPKYKIMNTVVKWFGTWIVVGQVMPILFGQKFLKDPNRREERRFWEQQLRSNPKKITKAAEGVIYRKGMEAELKNIQCPTLIMVGTQDIATVPAKSEKMHQLIPHSKLVYIDGAGHSSSIEEPEQVNKHLLEFLELTISNKYPVS